MTKQTTGTKEWSKHSFNFQRGCSNNCKYCYARKIIARFYPESDFDKPIAITTKTSLVLLQNKAKGVIMFPTMHDISFDNLDKAYEYLYVLLKLGNKILWVTKAGNAAEALMFQLVNSLKPSLKENLEIRVSIGSINDNILKYWEPNAPSFRDRWSLISMAKNLGFHTSISCEPMLDDSYFKLAEEWLFTTTRGIWLGFMNNHNEAEEPEMMARLPKPNNSLDMEKIMDLVSRYPSQVQLKDSITKALKGKSNG